MSFNLKKQEVLAKLDSLGYPFEDLEVFFTHVRLDCDISSGLEDLKFLTSAGYRSKLSVVSKDEKTEDGELEPVWKGILYVYF